MSSILSNSYFLDPRSIPGCALWIDAMDESTVIQTSNYVSSVIDKSSNAYILSNGVGFTYNQTKFNGTYPSFYNTTTTGTNVIGRNSSFSQRQPYTTYAVGFKIGGGTGYFTDCITYTTQRNALYYGTGSMIGAGLGINSTTTIMTQNFIHVGFWSNVNSVLHINGLFNVSGNIGKDGGNPIVGITLGSRLALDEPWDGHICEYIFYSGIHTISQRNQIEGYLAWKWGINSSLPVVHPYYYNPIVLHTPLFVPTSIPGCTLWLDAKDTSSIVFSNGFINNWNDKSGNNYNTTSVTGTSNRPTYNSSQGMLKTGNVSGWLTTPAITIPATTSRTVFSVCRLDPNYVYSNTGVTYDGHKIMYSVDTVNPFGVVINRHYSATNIYNWSFGLQLSNNAQLSYIGIGVNPNQGKYYLGCFQQLTRSTTSISLNGVNVLDITFPSGLPLPQSTPIDLKLTDSFLIGNAYNVGIDFFIGEIIYYNTSLTTSQRQQVEGYLAWKWGINSSNLPVSHPYYSNNPILPNITTAVVPNIIASTPSILSSTFSPANISNLTLWLDASDSSNVRFSTGANISNWIDKSSNRFVAISSNTVTYQSNIRGPNGVVRLGTNGYFYIPGPNFDLGTNDFSMFFAMKSPSTNNGLYGFMSKNYNDNAIGRSWNIWQDNQSRFYGNFRASNGQIFGTSFIITNLKISTWYIYSIVVKRTTTIEHLLYQTSFGGQSISANSTSTLSPSNTSLPLFIGAIVNNNCNIVYTYDYSAPGDLGEIIIYNGTAVTSSEQRQISEYLAFKWNRNIAVGIDPSLNSMLPYYNPITTTYFNPRSISDCTLWLDAMDSSSVILQGSTNNVVQWNDKSQMGYNFTTISGTPIFTSIQNKNGVLFRVSNLDLMRSISSNIPYTAGLTSLFCVVQTITTANSFNTIFSVGDSIDYSLRCYVNLNANDIFNGQLYNSNGISITSNIPGNINSTLFIDGIFNSTGSSNFQLSGNYLGSARAFNGYIYEVLMYSNTLTSLQRQTIQGYLAWKWGIQNNIPSSHPFKLYPSL